MNDKPTSSKPVSNHGTRLKAVGGIVLALGLGGAGVVYWLGSRSAKSADNLALLEYNKATTRQMGNLYGKWGLMVDNLLDDLKRPGIQAFVIALGATLFASGCFYLARPLERDDKPR